MSTVDRINDRFYTPTIDGEIQWEYGPAGVHLTFVSAGHGSGVAPRRIKRATHVLPWSVLVAIEDFSHAWKREEAS